MKIISEEVKIPKTGLLSSDYVETQLKACGKDPLRWAIVDVLDDSFLVSVSFYS